MVYEIYYNYITICMYNALDSLCTNLVHLHKKSTESLWESLVVILGKDPGYMHKHVMSKHVCE